MTILFVVTIDVDIEVDVILPLTINEWNEMNERMKYELTITNHSSIKAIDDCWLIHWLIEYIGVVHY
jgi:hypothetical protein